MQAVTTLFFTFGQYLVGQQKDILPIRIHREKGLYWFLYHGLIGNP